MQSVRTCRNAQKLSRHPSLQIGGCYEVHDIGDGTATSFWYDAWHNEDTLAERFPAIHSHCTHKNVSVDQVCASGSLDSTLFVPRLSHQATVEFSQLQQIVIQTSLSDTRDKRRGLFCLGHGKLDSGSLYRLLQSRNAPPHPAAKFIWNSHAPPTVQFFVWLLVHGRIQCRATLFRKTIVDLPVCEICNLADETSTHIAFGCRFADEFWAKLGIQPAQSADDGCLFCLTSPNHFPSKHFSTFVALCYWNLWKRRNGVIFRSEALTHQQVFRLNHNDAKLWKTRLPKRDKVIADAWCNLLLSNM